MEKEKEIFKDIKGYEGVYQVSNMGNVKSLKFDKEMILKNVISGLGYYKVRLYSDKAKTYPVHQLVAMTFLNHKPCGHKKVVDHINNNKLDNRACNLQSITQRHNSSKDRKGGSSNYAGVSYIKSEKKWQSHIQIKGKLVRLGRFEDELEASKMYQNALKKCL